MAKNDSLGKKILKGVVAGVLIGSSLITIGQAASDWKAEKEAEEPTTEVESTVDDATE